MRNFLFYSSLLFSTLAFSQVDFNNYTTLQSSGDIPSDFTTLTYEKLKDDLSTADTDMSKSKERVFFEGVNYAIDDLLHSGYVVYGDDVSKYVEEIAAKLLRKDKKLLRELRFYTLKSSHANAFSTEQGIVFVTTGLISQMTSEAQLALVIAHEISHYTEHHVIESFEYAANNRNRSIAQMSKYSKDKEFSADELGLELYHAAGYSVDEVLPTFDVLMYSYLPFDEVTISLDYFRNGNDSIFFPSSLFPDEYFEIQAEEDEDDSESSHPNIKSRKEALAELIEKKSNWGTEVNPLGDDKFEYIRNICRFETVRSQVMEAEYGKALYSIFLLEQDFPNSIYLDRMKAQTWFGIELYNVNSRVSRIILSKADYEGDSAPVHFFIRKMKKMAREAFALRQVYDMLQKHPEDDEIKLIWERTIEVAVLENEFDPSDFSTKSFLVASQEYADGQSEKEKEEGSGDEEAKKKSKYDRIKDKKDVNNSVESFDSTRYHIYLLYDVIEDEAFISLFEKFEEEAERIEDIESEYDAMSYSQRKKAIKQAQEDALKLGINDLIVVEPTVLSYQKYKVDRVKSEKLEETFADVIDETSDATGISIYSINSALLESQGTTGYNERSLLFNMLNQEAVSDISAFPVDYQLLKDIETNYGTEHVMFTVVQNSYDADISALGVMGTIFFYTAAFIYYPVKFLTGHETELDMVILNLKTGNVEAGESHYIRAKARKHTIGAHMYSIFSQLKATK